MATADALKCKWCGATTYAGVDANDPSRGKLFKDAHSLRMHEGRCAKNPNRRARKHRQPPPILRVASVAPEGWLLCIDANGNFYRAHRAKVIIEPE